MIGFLSFSAFGILAASSTDPDYEECQRHISLRLPSYPVCLFLQQKVREPDIDP